MNTYLPGLSISAYERLMRAHFPEFWQTLKLDRPDLPEILDQMNTYHNEFETDARGGRGDSYRLAQQDSNMRAVGILQLLRAACASTPFDALPVDYKVLDVLGGDGTIVRCLANHIGHARARQLILTSDIAAHMVHAALAQGCPAVRQQARSLLLRDDSYDAVLLAYGVHHVDPAERVATFQEGFRVIKPHGRIVIHDFEEESPMAVWFHQVVDRYSLSGHKYTHFTRQEFLDHLRAAGFRDISVFRLYDPFIAEGEDRQSVRNRLLDYVLNMYGLVKVGSGVRDTAELRDRLECLIEQHFQYDPCRVEGWQPHWKTSLTFYGEGGKYKAELPRVALVAVGTK